MGVFTVPDKNGQADPLGKYNLNPNVKITGVHNKFAFSWQGCIYMGMACIYCLCFTKSSTRTVL